MTKKKGSEKAARSKAGAGTELKKKSLELQERTKELDSLYKIIEIIEKQRFSPHVALQNIANVIPEAWQYPEIAGARITVNGIEFRSPKFRATKWSLQSEIVVNEEKVGSLEISYNEERPRSFKGPFLKEEVKLLSVISWKLSRFVEEYNRDKEWAKYKVKMKIAMGVGGHVASSKDTGQPVVADWQMILDILLKTDPQAHLRIIRKMMYHLSQDRNETFDRLKDVLCPKGTDSVDGKWCGLNMTNPKSDLKSLGQFQRGVFEIASQKMKPEEIMNLVISWLRQSNYRPLLLASEQPGIALGVIIDALNHFGSLPRAERILSKEDEISIIVSLIRRFLAENLTYINAAKKFISIDDFLELPKHIIGPSQGAGKLGGKTAGVIIAEKILEKYQDQDLDLYDIRFAKSWYLTSDTMRGFLHYNALDDVSHIKYLDSHDIRQEQPFLEQVFKNGVFPSEIVNGLREILRDLNGRPIIVRSSSHQEDSFGAAFSGKYKSLFIANTGSEQTRLNALMDAIAEVWASTFGPNVIEYRREKGLLDFPEEMGVLIQEVVGTRIGPYFTPAFAGVGFSNNEFRWSPRIRKEDGILRLVAGLGTRAVDRVADDYPILVSPSKPELRVNAQVDEIVQYSQRNMDVINMEKGIVETVPISSVISNHGNSYPMLSSIFSIYSDGQLSEARSALIDPASSELVVTFSSLFNKQIFLKQMKKVMSILKENLGTPVDVEFAHDGSNLYILQCRPQSQSMFYERVPIPSNIPDDRTLFSAKRYVTTGHRTGIEYIVYVNPSRYEALETREDMMAVARIVGELNFRLPRRKFILMGPGRWGSRGDIKLGVPVQYHDINNTAVLIEIACRKGGYLPDLSFGTHFFQDLVEANISYLPLYPDQDGTIFNRKLLSVGENRVTEFVKNYPHLVDVVKLVRVTDISGGGSLEIVMDGEANEAVAFLVPPDHSTWRMSKVKEIAEQLDPSLYGVEALYVIGSTKEYTTGPGSDIDLLIRFRGTPEQQEDLLGWLDDWSIRLARENKERTGYESKGLLDIHIVTDQDIVERTSWAVHIGSPYGAAKEIPLTRKTARSG